MIQNSPSGAAIDRTSLNATVGRLAAIATALLLVAFLVLSVSRAAFTASTANENNFVTTDGFVTLKDNDQGVALFKLNNVTPSTVTTKCIHVQYAGDLTSGDVNMYASVAAQATLTDLSPYLNVKVDAVAIPDLAFDPLGAPPDCGAYTTAALVPNAASNVYTGTLKNFPSNYATGRYAFDGAASTYAFKITVQVQNNAAASQAQADWSFTWETQST